MIAARPWTEAAQVVFERVPRLVAVLDFEGRFLEVNPHWTQVLGWQRDELIGGSALDLVHPDDLEAVRHENRRLAEGAVVHGFEARHRCRNGRYRTLRWSAAADPGRRLLVASGHDVTAETSLHADLAASRPMDEAVLPELQMFWRASPLLLGILSHDGVFQRVNPAWERTLGWSSADLVGHRYQEYIQKGDLERSAREADQLAHQAASTGFENRWRHRDGRLRVIRWTTSLLPERDLLLCAGQDVTDERRIQDALATSQSRLAALAHESELVLANSSDGIYKLDAQGRVTSVNPAGAAMLGYGALELVGLDLHATVHHKHADGTPYARADCPVQRTLDGGGRQTSPSEHYWRKDGTSFEAELVSVPVLDGERILGAVVTFRDLSERRRAQERFRGLLEASPDAMMVLTLDRLVLHVNGRLCRLFGYSQDELQGCPSTRLYAAATQARLPALRREMEQALAERGEATVSTRGLRKDGREFPAEVQVSRMHHGDQDVYVCAVRDVTPQMKLLEELQESNRELDAFAHSVAHDLHAPLRTMRGFTEVLLLDQGLVLSPQARRMLADVAKSAREMGALVDSLLAFARIGRHDLALEDVDPGPMAGAVVDDLRAQAPGRHIDVRLHPIPPCRADPALLRVVLWNLLGNAFKFTRDRSDARIEVGWDPAPATAPGTPPGTTPGAYFVRDNGAGFDMEHSGRLFGALERLHTADQFEGTGLGLSMVHRIVTRHGGRVWAHATPGAGATFWFSLPGPS
ncbi:MAG TPA: PAS domain S-box protein [Candidatus Thermoplasmatota archaeon]|nr:PAS domain S-box protein [Candidatus Thermoplasmatota archaeon]